MSAPIYAEKNFSSGNQVSLNDLMQDEVKFHEVFFEKAKKPASVDGDNPESIKSEKIENNRIFSLNIAKEKSSFI